MDDFVRSLNVSDLPVESIRAYPLATDSLTWFRLAFANYVPVCVAV